jgi:hypothetical protein
VCFWIRFKHFDAWLRIGFSIRSTLSASPQALHSRVRHDVINHGNHGNYLYGADLPCREWMHCLWQDTFSTLRPVPRVTLVLCRMSANGLEHSQLSLRQLQGFQVSTKRGFSTWFQNAQCCFSCFVSFGGNLAGERHGTSRVSASTISNLFVDFD